MTDGHLRAEIIGFDSGWGCKDFGCEDGPAALPADGILQALAMAGVHAKWRGPLGIKSLASHKDADIKEKTLPLLLEGLRRLAHHVRHAVEHGHIPIVIGGDHSSAIGTWSAAAAAINGKRNFGLIWLDAHLDSHTYETSSQGKWGGWWHGQPVTALTGNGLPEFLNIGGQGQKIDPRHISMIGIHSFESAETAYAKTHGIRVYYLDEVKQRGFKAVFDEAFIRATTGTDGFGLTIDLDAFSAEDAPGVGTAEGEGLVAPEVLPIIRALARKRGFKALEIAEFNPHNDKNNKTALLIEKLIASVFAKD